MIIVQRCAKSTDDAVSRSINNSSSGVGLGMHTCSQGAGAVAVQAPPRRQCSEPPLLSRPYAQTTDPERLS